VGTRLWWWCCGRCGGRWALCFCSVLTPSVSASARSVGECQCVQLAGKQTSCYFQALAANITLRDNLCYVSH
jgi:hypothetical protein